LAKLKVVKLLKVLVIGIVVAALLVAFHYLYFESKRLNYCGVDVFNDWRSYVASVMQKIPFVKQKIEYVPLKIGDPNSYYKSIISSYAEEINRKMEELSKKEKELDEMRKQLESEIGILKSLQKKWRSFYETEQLNKKVYKDVEESVKKLADLMKDSDAENVAVIINQDNISVKTIATALHYLPNDVSAEIIQALGKLNPKKAAEVMKYIGSIDQEIESIKMEKEELKTTMEKIVQEKQKVLEIKGLEDAVAKYINDMTVDQLGDLISDLNLSVDEIIKIVNLMEPDRKQKFLNYLREKDPKVFLEIFRRGIGG